MDITVGSGCLVSQMRAGPHQAGVLHRLLKRLRTKLGDSGQATATALPRALSPSRTGFGAREERSGPGAGWAQHDQVRERGAMLCLFEKTSNALQRNVSCTPQNKFSKTAAKLVAWLDHVRLRRRGRPERHNRTQTPKTDTAETDEENNSWQ